MRAAAEAPLFGELAFAWLTHVRPIRVDPDGETRLVRHLRALFLETEETLTGLGVELHMRHLLYTADLGAKYINKVQATGRRIVRHAQARKLWAAPNPFALAERLKEKPRKYELLELLELESVQPHFERARRRLFRVAVHTGMRPGELFGLRIEDVDLVRGCIEVRRSHDRNETKTGTERTVPIVPAIEKDIREALRDNPTGLVFPGPDGLMQSKDLKLTRSLRHAMADAGVGILGAWYRCRLPRLCDWRQYKAGPVVAMQCPRCGREALHKAKVRAVRWYDLRHMCATFHHRLKADGVCIALALGHALKGTKDTVYTHPSLEMMRRELAKWSVPR